MEAYTLPHVYWTGIKTLLYDSGNLNWGSVTTYRGRKCWEVEGDIHTWLKSNQYCRAIILQLTINKLFKNVN